MPRARLSGSVSGAVAVDPAELGGDATSPATPTRSRATRDLHPGAARISREDLVDALTCPVSGKLFVDPVTTVCGHSFSRRCLSTWMARTDRAPSCPTCRAPLSHENPRRWPVNTTLVDLVERFLGDELADALASEPGDGVDVRDGRGPGAGPAESELSLFVLDAITPGQEITLNVFEERYKLMVRRCLQGSRRFGMVGLIRDENDARRDDEAGDDEAYSSGDDSPRRNPTDGSDDDDDMTERARSSEISPPRVGGSEMRPRRSGGRDVPAFGRALGAPFAPHAPFADVGAECEIVAHQELVDGRLLVRCRAKRHVRLLDAREDPGGAGYLVARVEPVVDDEGEARDERIRATREFAATRVPPDASAPDASRTSTPLTARVAARAGLQRDSIGPRVADQRDWATTALLGERATAMHQTWLARVAGRPAAPGFSGAASSRSASLFRPNFLRRSYRDDVDNLLGWCGARPRADRLDDLSWWLTRVANPHPPIGAAVELRGECLAATSAKARFRVIHEKLVESMREVHRMRPSQWRGARPLASVNVAMATLRALEGRDGWRAAARECAFGDGEGYRDGDRNDRGVPRGNDYARVLEETLGALQKHAPTSLLLSDASDAANGAPPALSRPHVYPATPRTGGGAMPRGPIGASSSVSIDTSRLETSWDDSPESRDPETTSRLLLGTIERGAFPGLCWALYLALERVDDDAREELIHRLGDALSLSGAKKLPDEFPRRGDAAVAIRAFGGDGDASRGVGARNVVVRSSAVVADRLAAASLGSLQWVLAALAQTVLLVLLSVGLGAEAVERRAAPTIAKGAFVTAAAVALFGVLSFA